MRALLVLAASGLCFGFAADAFGDDFQTVLQRTYVRSPGKPVQTSDPFTACDPQGAFRIVVLNGPVASRKVSSGSISVNGVEVIFASDFNQGVDRIERQLAGLGLENQLRVALASGPGAEVVVSVEGIQRCQNVMIDSPAAGSVISQPSVVVKGDVAGILTPDVGMVVNGYPALVHEGRFAAVVPVDPTVTKLTASLSGSEGATVSHFIEISVLPSVPAATVGVTPDPEVGVAPFSATFQMHNVIPFASIEVDYDGDGTIDDVSSASDAFTHTYAAAGLFFPTATFVYPDGTRTTVVSAVQAYDPVSFEAQLQAKWITLKDALRRSDIDGALQNVTLRKRQMYRRMFEALAPDLPTVDQILTEISLVQHRGPTSEFQMLRAEGGRILSHFVLFAFDDDGVWRIKFF